MRVQQDFCLHIVILWFWTFCYDSLYVCVDIIEFYIALEIIWQYKCSKTEIKSCWLSAKTLSAWQNTIRTNDRIQWVTLFKSNLRYLQLVNFWKQIEYFTFFVNCVYRIFYCYCGIKSVVSLTCIYGLIYWENVELYRR